VRGYRRDALRCIVSWRQAFTRLARHEIVSFSMNEVCDGACATLRANTGSHGRASVSIGQTSNVTISEMGQPCTKNWSVFSTRLDM
jgi:hypothetical protein